MHTFLSRKQAAAYVTEHGCRTSWRTLQKMATTGGGPCYRIFGTRALYLRDDLDEWIEEKLSAPRRSTAEAGVRRPRANASKMEASRD